MLTVADYELIRRKFLIDGQSGREIAKELGRSRKTVAKAIANAVPALPAEGTAAAAGHPAYRTSIDAWLEEDQSRPRKQRHTAQRIYERLREEHELCGLASSVRRYVAWRKSGGRGFRATVLCPRGRGPGGLGRSHGDPEGGGAEGATVLHEALPQPCGVRAGLRAGEPGVVPGRPRAGLCLLRRRAQADGLRQPEVGGGLRGPGTGAALEPAVRGTAKLVPVRQPLLQRGQGEREGPRGEPGEAVAADVPDAAAGSSGPRRTQREAPRGLPAELDRTDREGHSHRALWEAEKPCLLPLAAEPFPACRERSSIVDKDRWCSSTSICIRCRCAGPTVRACSRASWSGWRSTATTSVWRCMGGAMARSGSCWNRGIICRFWSGNRAVWTRRRPFQGNPWGKDFALLRRELEYRLGDEGTRQFIRVLLLMTKHPEEEVRQAVGLCVRRRAFNVEAVMAAMRNEPLPDACAAVGPGPSAGVGRRGRRHPAGGPVRSTGPCGEEVAA